MEKLSILSINSKNGGGGGGTTSVSWGDVKGNISNQTDLINLLNSHETEYSKAGYFFNLVTDDSSGVRKYKLIILDKKGNTLFSEEIGSDVDSLIEAIEDLPMTFTNKTIDCGTI